MAAPHIISQNPRLSRHAPGQAYFEVVVDLLDADPGWFSHGMTCRVRCSTESQTMGTIFYRRLIRFANNLVEA